MASSFLPAVRITNFFLLGLWLAMPLLGRVSVGAYFWSIATFHFAVLFGLECLQMERCAKAQRWAIPLVGVLLLGSFVSAGRQIDQSTIEEAIDNYDAEDASGPGRACDDGVETPEV